MTPEERAREIGIMVAVAKLYSEQSCMLIKELRHEENYHFNESVKAVDLFIKKIEKNLGPEVSEMIQVITDEFHEAFNAIRKPNNPNE